jgi:thiamine-phosphate diphosphorylase
VNERRIPRFVVILDEAGARLSLTDVARAAIAGGADVIQLREKDRPESEVEQIVAGVIEEIGDPLQVAVNGFSGIAARQGTNLHLPDHDPCNRAQLTLAPGGALSRSIHQAVGATDADYVVLGNLRESSSKPGKSGIGVTAFADIARTSPVPVLGIGGIDPAWVCDVLAAGGHGVAVRSYVIAADDPEAAARAIRREIDECNTATN